MPGRDLQLADVVERCGVMGTPTVLFFRRGREVGRVVGFVGSGYLREVIESELVGASAVPPRQGG